MTASVRWKQARAASSRARAARRRSRPAGWYRIWIRNRTLGRGCCDFSAAMRPDRAMRILVFGGTGFVGLNIAAALLARGHTVTLFDRAALPPSAAKEFASHADRLAVNQGDIRDEKTIEQVIAAGHDAIVLGAA